MASLNDLPNGLLVDSFVRLDLITAHRCELVCKRWHSVISEPYFANLFSKDEKISFPLFRCRSHREEKQILDCKSHSYHLNKELSMESGSLIVVASSNDLLLCESGDDYLVVNPVTEEFARLPPCPEPRLYGTFYTGFTSMEDGEYVVLRITNQNSCDEFSGSIIWLFSSKTSAWVQIPSPTLKERLCVRNPVGVEFRGKLFWHTDEEVIGIDPFNIASVDNPWFLIHLPKGLVTGNTVNRYLGVCRKSLRFCKYSPCELDGTGKFDSILRVWDLNDSSEWILQRHVSMRDSLEKQGCYIWSTKVMFCDLNDPDIIFIKNFTWRNSVGVVNIFSFNLSTCEMIKVKSILEQKGLDQYRFCEAIPWRLQWQPTPLHR